jgi:alkylation response protein AidB-like acyl-CoA dehydrogenase
LLDEYRYLLKNNLYDMEILESPLTWTAKAEQLAAVFEKRAADHDSDGSFVTKNYAELKAAGIFSALVPTEFGGGGALYSEVCAILRTLAKSCGSTALALSMHQHLVAAAVWRNKNKGEAGPMLQKVASGQVVLISTGARDWIDSNGEMVKVEGGFQVSARKPFASGSVIGDIAVTSAPYEHPTEGWQVLHFPVSMKSAGASVHNDWDVLGMRGTGSQTIVFDKVFVPETSIVLTRPRTGFHPVWNIVMTVAMPLIMSVYVGMAEKALELTLAHARKQSKNSEHLPLIVGRLNNSVVAARAQWQQMIRLCNEINFTPSETTTIEMLSLKTNTVNACIQALHESMQAIGGQSFYKVNPIERLFRDVQASQFHPLPEFEQYLFTGTRLLKGQPKN